MKSLETVGSVFFGAVMVLVAVMFFGDLFSDVSKPVKYIEFPPSLSENDMGPEIFSFDNPDDYYSYLLDKRMNIRNKDDKESKLEHKTLTIWMKNIRKHYGDL